MDAAEARTRRLTTQGLWAPAGARPGDIVRRLGAVQAQEFPYALWSLAARITPTERPSAADLSVEYDLGRILRTHVLRPTWHFVTPEDARWMLTLTAPRVRQIERPYLNQLGLDADVLARATDAFAAAVAGGRHRTRQHLRDALDSVGVEVPNTAMPHLLMIAELERVLISGATDGKQRTYAGFDERVPPTFVDGASAFDRENALVELASRYFGSRGPASVKDMSLWSGLTMADCRTGLKGALDRSPGCLEQVEVDGVACWMPPAPTPMAPQSPRYDLLQGYDEYVMGYSETRGVMAPAGFSPTQAPVALFHAALRDGVVFGFWRHQLRATEATIELRPFTGLDPSEAHELELALDAYGSHLGLPTRLELV